MKKQIINEKSSCCNAYVLFWTNTFPDHKIVAYKQCSKCKRKKGKSF